MGNLNMSAGFPLLRIDIPESARERIELLGPLWWVCSGLG